MVGALPTKTKLKSHTHIGCGFFTFWSQGESGGASGGAIYVENKTDFSR
jgi:hypothetical protein